MNAADIDCARATSRASLAREAGALALRYFRASSRSRPKSKGVAQDWVSVADRAVEELIAVQRSWRRFPATPMLGEEAGGADRRRRVDLDPIDGTLNFVHGVRYWCVSIAVHRRRRRRIGVVYDPPLDELFFAAAQGGERTLNGAPMHVIRARGSIAR